MASKRRLRWLSIETRRNETCAYDSSQKRRSGAFNARASSQNLHPQERGGKPPLLVSTESLTLRRACKSVAYTAHDSRLGGAACPKLRHGRPLLAPFGRLLIGMRSAEYCHLLEWFADELDRHRQPACTESTTNRDRWLPCDVEWNGKAWLLQYRPLRHRVDSRRLRRLRGRQQ